MASAEASILLKIKEEGLNAFNKVENSFKDVTVAAAKVAAGVAAVGAAFGKLALDAAAFDDVKRAFNSLAASQGQDADLILEKMQEATAGTIDQLELMKQANQALLLGLPVDRFDDILKVARGAAKSTGESMEFMLNSIVTGLGRGSKLMLDNLGILVDTNKAYEDFAVTLDKTADELTDTEKKQAFINAALEAGLENLENLGPLQASATDNWAKFKAGIKDASVTIGSIVLPIFEDLLKTINGWLDTFKEMTTELELKQFFLAVGMMVIDLQSKWETFVEGLKLIPQDLAGIGRAIKAALTLDFDAISEEQKKAGERRSNLLKEIEQKRIRDIADLEQGFLRERFEDREKEAEKAIDIEIKKEQFKQKQIKKAEQEARQTKEIEDKKLREKELKELERIKEKRKELSDEITLAETSDMESFFDRRQARLEEIINSERSNQAEREEALLELDRLQLEIIKHRKDEERIAAQEAKKADEERIASFNTTTTTILESGLQGLASTALSFFVDTLLPGFGEAAGKIFSFLTQDTEEFMANIESLFSVEFLGNLFKNITALIEELPTLISGVIDFIVDNLPELTQKLIEALIANLPELQSALVKAFIETVLDPRFAVELAAAMAKGFGQGVKDAAGDIAEAIRKAFKDAVNILDIGGGGGGGFLGGLASSVGGALGFAHGGIVPGYAGGGLVDNTLGLLTPGEMVINRASTAANMDLLNAINDSNGRSVGMGTNITINVQGGLLGDENQARQFARAVDEQLYKLRLGNESRSFDQGLT